jgi:hypothetical protein
MLRARASDPAEPDVLGRSDHNARSHFPLSLGEAPNYMLFTDKAHLSEPKGRSLRDFDPGGPVPILETRWRAECR